MCTTVSNTRCGTTLIGWPEWKHLFAQKSLSLLVLREVTLSLSNLSIFIPGRRGVTLRRGPYLSSHLRRQEGLSAPNILYYSQSRAQSLASPQRSTESATAGTTPGAGWDCGIPRVWRVGIPGWVYQAPYYPGCVYTRLPTTLGVYPPCISGCIPAMYLRVYTQHGPQGVYPAWSSGCIPTRVYLRVYSHQGVPQGVYHQHIPQGVYHQHIPQGGYPRCICTMVGIPAVYAPWWVCTSRVCTTVGMYLSGMHNGGLIPPGLGECGIFSPWVWEGGSYSHCVILPVSHTFLPVSHPFLSVSHLQTGLDGRLGQS